jgi:hypothetical protein
MKIPARSIRQITWLLEDQFGVMAVLLTSYLNYKGKEDKFKRTDPLIDSLGQMKIKGKPLAE